MKKALIKKILITLSYIINITILCSMTLYNKYPIIQGDSGGYVKRAFSREINNHWALFYSLFVWVTSLNISLFFVIFFQNALILMMLHVIMSRIFQKNIHIYTLIIVLVVTVFSSLSFITNLLMSDIFTSMGILSISAVTFLDLRRRENIFFYVVILFSLVAHNSHLPIYIGVVLVNILICFNVSCGEKNTKRIFNNALILIFLFTFSVKVLNPTVQSFFIYGPSNEASVSSGNISDSKYHFVWSRLYENDKYSLFVDKYCPEKRYTYLCNDKVMNDIGHGLKFKKLFHGSNIDFLKEIEDAGRNIVKDRELLWILFESRIHKIIYLLKNNKWIPQL
jgi:hypothetical protein